MSGQAYYSESEMVAILWDMVAEHGSQKRVAEIIGITPTYLSDILHGDRKISESVSRRIGYLKQTVFTKDEE